MDEVASQEARDAIFVIQSRARGLQRSIREWAVRRGWGGRPVNEKHAQGILIAALGF